MKKRREIQDAAMGRGNTRGKGTRDPGIYLPGGIAGMGRWVGGVWIGEEKKGPRGNKINDKGLKKLKCGEDNRLH